MAVGAAVTGTGTVTGSTYFSLSQVRQLFSYKYIFRHHKSPKKSKHRTPEKKSKHSDKSRDSGRDRKRERSGSSHKSPKKKSRHH